MPTNAERALAEILEMLGEDYYNVPFSDDGLDAVKKRFEETLGDYFRKIEPNVDPPGRDLWRGPDIKEMANFILGYAVPQIAIALKNVAEQEGEDVDAKTVRTVSKTVMRDGKTEELCAFMLSTYEKKVMHQVEPTAICAGIESRKKKRPDAEPSEAARPRP